MLERKAIQLGMGPVGWNPRTPATPRSRTERVNGWADATRDHASQEASRCPRTKWRTAAPMDGSQGETLVPYGTPRGWQRAGELGRNGEPGLTGGVSSRRGSVAP